MEARHSQQLFFDPDQYPEDTLKAFEEFTQLFELGYDAQFPDPPKVSMDAAIDRWKAWPYAGYFQRGGSWGNFLRPWSLHHLKTPFHTKNRTNF